MAELKTQPTAQSAMGFIDGLGSDTQRAQCHGLVRIMAKASGAAPVMWGKSIVGFGNHHYRYASGREGDWFVVGFAPRKSGLTLYLMDGFDDRAELLQALGRHKVGKSCLHLRSLDGIDIEVLGKLITASVKRMRARDQ
ncbi:MAG: DUF1801 domain-containing protein [Rhizobacter sp.]|nr:DUF1801 domain-containing protein [Rhizobacter sp.]